MEAKYLVVLQEHPDRWIAGQWYGRCDALRYISAYDSKNDPATWRRRRARMQYGAAKRDGEMTLPRWRAETAQGAWRYNSAARQLEGAAPTSVVPAAWRENVPAAQRELERQLMAKTAKAAEDAREELARPTPEILCVS
eukprot:SAG11_NODE_3737_length_2257_cov_19.759500_1_plen_139_part_00